MAPFPLGDTFLLHSKAGSQKTLFIDFDGTNVSGTYWNSDEGVPAGNYPAWTLDGDAATFNDAEREAIQTIWQRVAEDYAPFDVDVTTAGPGRSRDRRAPTPPTCLRHPGAVTPSTMRRRRICGTGSCGGVAYIDVFDGSRATTALPAGLGLPAVARATAAKNIAEAASHEVGHNLGLEPRRQTAPVRATTRGHAIWAPIMGVGYYQAGRPVEQGRVHQRQQHRGRPRGDRRTHAVPRPTKRVAPCPPPAPRRRAPSTSPRPPTRTSTCSAPAPAH